MALSLSQFPVTSSFPPASGKNIHPNTSLRIKPTPIFPQSFKSTPIKPTNKRNQLIIINSSEKSPQNNKNDNVSSKSESEIVSTESPPQRTDNTAVNAGGDDLLELGSEIKKIMKGREEQGGGFWSGVAEEIGEIEWPAFNKVLGTTGVVLGVIAGSSVVLLTVNAVLAELSDRVFAGRGIQDFFS